eukprot:3335630-Prymnesium_polylepis.1
MAFCRQTLNSGEFRVRALCRNLHSPRATALAEMGAEVVFGDNSDVDSLRDGFADAHGVYGITTWSGSSFDTSGQVVRAHNLDAAHLEQSEFAQGVNIIGAAEATPGLRHFVLQSMHRSGKEPEDHAVPAPMHRAPPCPLPNPLRARVEERQPGPTTWLTTRAHGQPRLAADRAKWRLEDELRRSTLPWSILRQPTYLENFGNDQAASTGTQLRLLRPGVISGLLERDVELTVVAVEDLGALAAAMFQRRDEARAAPSAPNAPPRA